MDWQINTYESGDNDNQCQDDEQWELPHRQHPLPIIPVGLFAIEHGLDLCRRDVDDTDVISDLLDISS